MPDVPPPAQPEEGEPTQPDSPEFPDIEVGRAQRFWSALTALPTDLSGMDLRPIYALAQTGDEIRAVNDREDAWEPKSSHIHGTLYPGPIGRFGNPSARNLDRWKIASTHAAEVRAKAYKDRLQVNLDVVNQGEGNTAVVMAMRLLYEAAFSQMNNDKVDNIFIPKGVTSEDMAASLSALRVIQMALDELDRLAQSAINQQREYLIVELSTFELLGRHGK
ncbi:MAG: hypothetical protein EOP06_04125 [Proteobacteria bacterium]|nr:MAG: hypothetical protein EOP06_04125 [Pseudomonadota bacterium]